MEEKNNKISDLEEGLNSREFKSDLSPRSTFSPQTTNVEQEWKHDTPPTTFPVQEFQAPRAAGSIFKKIFVISATFFILSASVAAFIFYGGLNIISSNKVDMVFVGPVSIAAGNELDFDVIIQNQNRTPLLNAQLYIDYPDGTKQAVDISQDLLHSKEDIGDVAAKTDVKRTIRSVLFGREQSAKEIKVTLEYGVKNSNGVFKKEKSYKVAISSTPLTMNISHPTEVASGQEISFTVEIVSNSSVPLTNLLVTADYPRGFEFKSADPVALDATAWKILVLKPGDKKTITITGKTEGEENDEKIFRFNVGIGSSVNDKAISTSFLASSESVTVRRPPLAAGIELGTSNVREYISSPGEVVNGQITLTNNLTTQLNDIQASIALSGQALDATSPQATGALYRLPTKTISWDKTTASSLDSVAPGGNVTLSFSLASLPPSVIAGLKNGQIAIAFNASAKAVGSNQLVTTSTNGKIKIQPSLSINKSIAYTSGSRPPKSETKTVYTVDWNVTQSSDDIAGAEMRASLPSYVKWQNVISPASEVVTFIPERNEVVWRVGAIPGGVVGTVARHVSFQVEIIPSFSQVGTAPSILEGITFKATDTFTGNQIQLNGGTLTTPEQVVE